MARLATSAASLRVTTTQVAQVTDVTLNFNNTLVDCTGLGDTYKKYAKTLESSELQISGKLDTANAQHTAFRTAAMAADATIANLRLYIDGTHYYAFPATAQIANWKESADAPGVLLFSATIKSNGTLSYT